MLKQCPGHLSMLNHLSTSAAVKWLGAKAPATLALDGKLSKEEVVEQIRFWSDKKGKSVTQPG